MDLKRNILGQILYTSTFHMYRILLPIYLYSKLVTFEKLLETEIIII